MAYSKNNLSLVFSFIGAGPKVWMYTEASVSDATMTGAGYISDGVTMGMSKGDLVDVLDVSSPKYKRYQVASTSGTGVTLAAATAIT